MDMLKGLLEPITRDMIHFREQLEEQEKTNKKMLEGLDKVDKLETIVSTLATKVTVAEAAAVTLQSTAASSASSVDSMGSNAKRYRPTSDAGHSQQQRGASNQENDALRRWVNGFPRPVLAQVREARFAWVKEHAPATVSQEMTAKFARVSQSYGIHFVTTTAAFAVQKWAK